MVAHYKFLLMEVTLMIETYSFSGNVVTYLGAIALFVTPVLLYWIFSSYWKSPYRK